MAHESSKLNAKNDCCGGPAPKQIDACCLEDADAKASGKKGCGCNDQEQNHLDQNAHSGCCN